MKPLTNLSNAELQIAAVGERYRQTTMRLGRFVSDVQRALERDNERHLSIMQKLRAAERGEQPKGPPPPESIALELEVDEFNVLVEVVEDALDAMSHFPGMLAEMVFIHLMAAFEAFLTDLLRSILLHRPEMLKSEKRVTFEEVIDAKSKDELISGLADKEVSSLSYSSFKKQALYIEQRFGLDLQLSVQALSDLAEAYARRNVLLHNAGLVDQQFKEAVPRTDFELGEKIGISLSYWESIRASLDKLASTLENGAVKRFFTAETK